MNKTQAACDRLTQSRNQLRQALGQQNNPLGGAQVKLLAKTAYGVVAAMVRSRPVVAVVGTALVGALLVRTRAWRWLSVSALFASLVPQLVKALIPQEKR